MSSPAEKRFPFGSQLETVNSQWAVKWAKLSSSEDPAGSPLLTAGPVSYSTGVSLGACSVAISLVATGGSDGAH